METSIIALGSAAAVLGLVIGATAIAGTIFGLSRVLGLPAFGEAIRNNAVAVLYAGVLFGFATLGRAAVENALSGFAWLQRSPDDLGLALRLVVMLVEQAVLTTGVGAVVVGCGTMVFMRATRGIDELAEIRAGNVGPSLVLAAIVVVLAILVTPGLTTAMQGLVPLPTLVDLEPAPGAPT